MNFSAGACVNLDRPGQNRKQLLSVVILGPRHEFRHMLGYRGYERSEWMIDLIDSSAFVATQRDLGVAALVRLGEACDRVPLEHLL